jgi:hypothetical protein
MHFQDQVVHKKPNAPKILLRTGPNGPATNFIDWPEILQIVGFSNGLLQCRDVTNSNNFFQVSTKSMVELYE